MIPGINVINFSEEWDKDAWRGLSKTMGEAYDMGVCTFRIWVHFNFYHARRMEDGGWTMEKEFRDTLLKEAQNWPGEIIFDWSWGYYGDRLADTWLLSLMSGHFRPLVNEWREIISVLGEERFSLSVGNEFDGLLRVGFISDELRSIFLRELTYLGEGFTAGWLNEYSFDDSLLGCLPDEQIARFSYYEKNEGYARDMGGIERSPIIRRGKWGVSEFGIDAIDPKTGHSRSMSERVEVMRQRMALFAEHGAQDVFIWALGAGDEYAWQEDPSYIKAFVEACKNVPLREF